MNYDENVAVLLPLLHCSQVPALITRQTTWVSTALHHYIISLTREKSMNQSYSCIATTTKIKKVYSMCDTRAGL